MDLLVRRGSTFHQVSPEGVFYRQGGQWRLAKAVYVRKGNAWKLVWAPVNPDTIERHDPHSVLQNQGNEYRTPVTQPMVTSVKVSITARVQGLVFAGFTGNQYWQTVTVKWRIERRINGGAWVALREDQFSHGRGSQILFTTPFDASEDRDYTFNFTPSAEEAYEFRVVHAGESSTSGGYFDADQRNGTWVRVNSIEIRHEWVGKV